MPLSTLTFLWPYAALCWPLPLLMLLWPAANRSGRAFTAVRFPAIERLYAAFPDARAGGKRSVFSLPLIFLWLAWTACVIALARPQLPGERIPLHAESRDIMLAVDLSGSMRALDFSTKTQYIDRLDITKQAVTDFVTARAGDRIGLIVFGQQAFLASPLTADTHAVGAMLQEFTPGMAGDATAIGDALGLAVKALRDSPEASRAIILLTDGANTAGTLPPPKAAELAASYNMRVYTIAIGKGGDVPFPDGRGGVTLANLPIDEALLQDIARTTGGTFYRATDTRALARVYKEIDALESVEQDEESLQLYQPLFRYPLAFALVCLGCVYITRRRS